jgi:PPOX class probable F420-dependent enzyme
MANFTLSTDDDSGPLVRVSVVDGRAKVANLVRDPRASLLVTSPDGWSYAVLEGSAEFSPVAQALDDETVEELVEVYRKIRGEEHPDWDDYRRAMVADGRRVLRIRVSRVYGLIQ